jgi:type IV pilus assembly protein PilX
MNQISHKNRQQGAVLVISLIMLLVMTLIGITGMQTTVLEEKMAGNMRDQNLAFQAAESALRNGEMDTGANYSLTSSFLSTCANGLCLPSATAVPVWADPTTTNPVNWSSSTNTIAYASQTVGVAVTNIGGIAAQPEYIVELLPEPPKAPGQSLAKGKGSAIPIETFRITARGVGGTTTASAMVQSIYKK